MTQYAFSHDWHQERERLRELETLLDPGTIRHLTALGIRPGWSCLEVGAGAGSIADWLCRQVGPTGAVLATDLDVQFLAELTQPNLRVERHDIVRDPLPDCTFDLIHARAVLEHIPERQAVVRRFIQALRPSRWLLVEDLDNHLILNATLPDTPFAEPLRVALRQLRASAQYDPEYGRQLYEVLRAEGLMRVGAEARAYIEPGGSGRATRVWQLVLERLRDRLLEARAITPGDYDAAIDALGSSDYGVMSPLFWAAWGQRRI